MNRVAAAAVSPIDVEWLTVSERRPCPICGNHATCSTHASQSFASCIKHPSEWPLTNGAWLHRLPRDPEESGPVATWELVSANDAQNDTVVADIHG